MLVNYRLFFLGIHFADLSYFYFNVVDTPVCATGVRTFHEKAAANDNVKVLCLSADLPFAMGRFCEAEGIENVEVFSTFRSRFAESVGAEIVSGPLKALCARVCIVTNEKHEVVFVSYPDEVTEQVDIDGALAAIATPAEE